jgi:hypothetical protein
MACNEPKSVSKGKFGGIAFMEKHGQSYEAGGYRIPCGKCLGCKMDRAHSWAIRNKHETSLWDHNSFLTLTYAENPYSLDYSHIQLFMRKLRKTLNGDLPSPCGNHFPIRFFCAGEYGEKFDRPHYHILLYNVFIPDQKPLKVGLNKSELLDKLWEKGNVSIGPLYPERAAYVSQYSMKKIYGRGALETHYKGRKPEFIQMSNRPGIGYWWYTQFKNDVLPKDYVVVEGTRRKIPRYYEKLFRKLNDKDPYAGKEEENVWAQITERREAKGLEMDPADRGLARLHCREEILRSQLAEKQPSRTL